MSSRTIQDPTYSMVVMVEGFKTPELEGLAEAFRTQDMLLVSVLNREPTTWPPQLRHMTLTNGCDG